MLIKGLYSKGKLSSKSREGTNPSTKRLYSTIMKMKTKISNLIIGTFGNLFIGTKENAQNFKRESLIENIYAQNELWRDVSLVNFERMCEYVLVMEGARALLFFFLIWVLILAFHKKYSNIPKWSLLTKKCFKRSI